MKNIFKSKFSALLGVTVMAAVILLSLSSCMSMLMSLVASQAASQYKNFGVFDGSVPAGQMCQLRFALINVTSFNGKPVSWGDKANNLGFVGVPAGTNTIVFDWVSETTNMVRTDYDSVKGGTSYRYVVTTSGLRNISFPGVEMLPGHNYFIGGGLDKDGRLRTYMIDMTYTPSGLYGDNVANAPRVSKARTEFEGTWKNSFGETFEFTGNRWMQTLPPQTGSNSSQNLIRMRGTFRFSDGIMVLYITDTSVEMGTGMWSGVWVNIKALKNAYIYKYSFRGSNLLLELPYVLPVMTYTR